MVAVKTSLALLLATSLLAATGCGGSASGGSVSSTSGSSTPQSLYVVQTDPVTGTGSVLQFKAQSNGAVSPVSTFTAPSDVVFSFAVLDNQGNIYVSDFYWDSNNDIVSEVRVYPAGATGTATPTRTIAGSATGFNLAMSDYGELAIDSSGQLYVASLNSISVFAPGANGNVAPIRVISGASTLISSPESIALDAAGNLYVANQESIVPAGVENTILVFSPTATGNATPTRVISIGGLASEMGVPYGVAVDSAGDIFATLNGGNENLGIVEYGPGASGIATPIRTIAQDSTGLLGRAYGGIAIDASGNIYVATSDFSSGTPAIVTYAPSASGNATPTSVITSPEWTSVYEEQLFLQ